MPHGWAAATASILTPTDTGKSLSVSSTHRSGAYAGTAFPFARKPLKTGSTSATFRAYNNSFANNFGNK